MARTSDLTTAAALLGRKGGQARAKNMTATERRANAVALAHARSRSLSPARRSEIARQGALAKAAKHRQRQQDR